MKRLIMLFLFLGFIKLNFEEWTGFTGQWVKMDRISGWQDLRDCFL